MMDEGALYQKSILERLLELFLQLGICQKFFVSVLAGMMIDQNPGVGGYRLFFGFLVAMLVLGAVFVLVWKSYLKKHPKVN